MHAESTATAGSFRSGGQVLSLFADPLNVAILRAHADGPIRFAELRERVGGPAQTTLRGHVVNLRSIGVLAKLERSGMPYTVENELTKTGTGLLLVADAIEAWLARAPHGPMPMGSEHAKAAVKALIGGWSSTMLHALAARPFTLTELDALISDLSYPAGERRLSAMRAARQVERLQGQGQGTPHAVTDWARQAAGPLAVAMRCECAYMQEQMGPLTQIDVEAAFLLAVPLVALSENASGSCLLGVDTGPADGGGERRRLAGVHVVVSNGAIESCVSLLEPDPRTWALGTAETWLGAIIDPQLDRLRIGGADPELARNLVGAIHDALFPV